MNLIIDTKESRVIFFESLLYKYKDCLLIPDYLYKKQQEPNYEFVDNIGSDKEHRVYLDKVIGTTHGRYKGYSWYENFFQLKRRDTIYETLLKDSVEKYEKMILILIKYHL